MAWQAGHPNILFCGQHFIQIMPCASHIFLLVENDMSSVCHHQPSEEKLLALLAFFSFF